MDIRQRLAIFYERLRLAPVARNAEEAFSLICRVLEEVETELCPVPPQNPPSLKTFDGRMYVPQRDKIKIRPDGSWWVKTRQHRMSINADGSFVIYRRTQPGRLAEEFRKSGAPR